MRARDSDVRWGEKFEPLTKFEKELQRRLLGLSQDFPDEFTSWLRRQLELDPPQLLTKSVSGVYNVPRCRVHHSADQGIPNTTVTALAFDSERFDPWAMHNPATNNTRITLKKPGVYLVVTNVVFDAAASGERYCAIRVNGATIIATLRTIVSGGANYGDLNVSTVYAFQADDYIEVIVYQAAGGTLNILSRANYSPEFTATFLGDYPPS